MAILQLKISLREIKPVIWREFLVSDFWSFHRLHNIIQSVMGWEDYHLHEFDVDGVKIGPIDEDVDYDLEDSKKTKLSDYINSKGQKFSYVYDFGDTWEHEIVVKDIKEEDIKDIDKLPICLNGKRRCPPEDCGGVFGYEEILEIKKDKNHPEYKEKIIGWLGEDFNLEEFDIKEINNKLSKIK